MISYAHGFADCLDNSLKCGSTAGDGFQGRGFDFGKRFLPDRKPPVAPLQRPDGYWLLAATHRLRPAVVEAR